MSNPTHIQSFLDSHAPMLAIVDEILNEWNGEGCLQFPVLMGKVSAKLSWDEKQTRAKEPIIREFVRTHPDWYVTRGAHGGIMRASEKQKKDAVIAAKKAAKAELEAQLAKKVADAAAQAAQPAADSADNTNTVSE